MLRFGPKAEVPIRSPSPVERCLCSHKCSWFRHDLGDRQRVLRSIRTSCGWSRPAFRWIAPYPVGAPASGEGEGVGRGGVRRLMQLATGRPPNGQHLGGPHVSVEGGAESCRPTESRRALPRPVARARHTCTVSSVSLATVPVSCESDITACGVVAPRWWWCVRARESSRRAHQCCTRPANRTPARRGVEWRGCGRSKGRPFQGPARSGRPSPPASAPTPAPPPCRPGAKIMLRHPNGEHSSIV